MTDGTKSESEINVERSRYGFPLYTGDNVIREGTVTRIPFKPPKPSTIPKEKRFNKFPPSFQPLEEEENTEGLSYEERRRKEFARANKYYKKATEEQERQRAETMKLIEEANRRFLESIAKEKEGEQADIEEIKEKPQVEDEPKHGRGFEDEISSEGTQHTIDDETIWVMYKGVRDVTGLDKKYHHIIGFRDGIKVGFTLNKLMGLSVKTSGDTLAKFQAPKHQRTVIVDRDLTWVYGNVSGIIEKQEDVELVKRLIAIEKWYNTYNECDFRVEKSVEYNNGMITGCCMAIIRDRRKEDKIVNYGKRYHITDYNSCDINKLCAANYYKNRAYAALGKMLRKRMIKPTSKRVMNVYKRWLGEQLHYGVTINYQNFWLDYCHLRANRKQMVYPFYFQLIDCEKIYNKITRNSKLIKHLYVLRDELQRFMSVKKDIANNEFLRDIDKMHEMLFANNCPEYFPKHLKLLVIDYLPRNIQFREKSLIMTRVLGTVIPVYLRQLNKKAKCNMNWIMKYSNLVGKYFITDRFHADWVLYDFSENKAHIGLVNIKLGSHVVSMLGIPCCNGVVRYLHLDYAHSCLDNTVTRRMYQHLQGNFVCYSGKQNSIDELFNEVMIEKVKLNSNDSVNKLINYYKDTQCPNFFREDQIFVKDEIFQDKGVNTNNEILRLINVSHKVSKLLIYGLIIYMLSVKPIYSIILKLSGILDSKDDYEFIKIGKELSDKCKGLQNLIDINLKPLFEIHNIVNRTYTPIDWEQEKFNREEPDVARVPVDYVYSKAKDIFMRSRSIRYDYARYNKQTWQQFWSSRLEWATAGAFSSQYDKDKKQIEQFDEDFRNKLFYFISLPNEISLFHFLNRKSELSATVSIKYEWAKQRAIYGCDVTNYVIAQFVMQNCEDLLTRDMAIGRNSKLEVVEDKIYYILDGKAPFCLDFEDFNSQHSLENMRAVICAYLDTWADRMTGEQRTAAYWLLDSIDNQWVEDSIGTRSKYKARGTLLSGWRLTSFVNTILNVVYFNYLQQGYEVKHNSIHSGDDILVGVTNMRQVQNIYKNCRKVNVRLSPLKCFYGSVAEFLRVEHKSSESGQYIPRSVATLVAGKIESKPAFNIRDVLEALHTRAREAIKRGADICFIKCLFRVQAYYWGQRFGIDQQTVNLICLTDRTQGGLAEDVVTVDKMIKLIPDPDKLKLYIEGELPKVQPGVYQYVNNCLKFLPNKVFEIEHIARFVQDKINYSMARIPNVVIVTQLDREKYLYIRQIRCFKGTFKHLVSTFSEYGKIRLIGQTLEMFKTIRKDSRIAQFLSHSKDPLLALGVIIS